MPDLGPLGHSRPAHRVHGWCSHCPGRTVAEELAAWQVREDARAADDWEARAKALEATVARVRHALMNQSYLTSLDEAIAAALDPQEQS